MSNRLTKLLAEAAGEQVDQIEDMTAEIDRLRVEVERWKSVIGVGTKEDAAEIAALKAELAALTARLDVAREDEAKVAVRLTASEAEVEKLIKEAAELRLAHAGLARAVKRGLGLKNWPTFHGPWRDGVERLVAEAKSRAEAAEAARDTWAAELREADSATEAAEARVAGLEVALRDLMLAHEDNDYESPHLCDSCVAARAALEKP